MNILQIAPAWISTPPREYGGTEWVIYNLTRGLTGLNHTVTLFATKNSQPGTKLKYTFDRGFLEMGIPWSAALPALVHYHQAFKLAGNFDIVHAHLSSATDIIILPFLADLADRAVPAVMTIHGHKPYDRYSGMDRYYLNLYGKKVTGVNISQAMARVCPRQFRRCGVVHNSLDTSLYKFNPKGGKYLTWLGKIIPDKGTHEAILAAKAAGEQLVFAGVVDHFQAVSVKYFERKVKPLIDGRQIVYLGPADLKLKNKLLGGAKGFLNPIQWIEPFGMVMAESMACGTPVISYARGAAPEIIKDGETGFLVSTLRQMVKAISKLDQIDRQACRARIEKNFTPQIAAQKYLKIYQQEVKRYARKTVLPSKYPYMDKQKLHDRQFV